MLEVRIERKRFDNASLANGDERHRVDETQEPLATLEQEVEAGVVRPDGRSSPGTL